MRSKRPRLPVIPAKYRRFDPSQWPGGPGQWISEREQWNSIQPEVLYAGTSPAGLSWSYLAGPLGDVTDCMQARREARLAYDRGSDLRPGERSQGAIE